MADEVELPLQGLDLVIHLGSEVNERTIKAPRRVARFCASVPGPTLWFACSMSWVCPGAYLRT